MTDTSLINALSAGCGWNTPGATLPTRESLSHKGYTGPYNCLLCSEALETTGHVLCQCPVAQAAIREANACHAVLKSGFCFRATIYIHKNNWEQLLMLLWALWKNRNSTLWNATCKTAPEIVVATFTWYEQYLQVQKMQPQGKATKPSKYWTPPSSPQLKINVDGAFLPSKDIGGIGGVIRRRDGSFVAGFAKRVMHASSPKQVELLAIREGIDFLRQRSLQGVCLESDCQVAIQEIGAEDFELNENANLLMDIHQSGQFVHNLDFSFAPRSANTVAHRLAAIAYESNTTHVWIDQAPESILDALAFDCNHLP